MYKLKFNNNFIYELENRLKIKTADRKEDG